MPALEQTDRLQKAVYWEARAETYDDYGQPKVEAPIELEVRWVWKSRMMAGPQGNPVSVDATVVVDREIPIGSTMWEGELVDWYGTGSAGADDTVMEVIASSTTSDIKNRVTRRTVGLVFYRDSLPEEV